MSGGKVHLSQAPGVPEPSALLYIPLPRLQFLYVPMVDEFSLSLATDIAAQKGHLTKPTWLSLPARKAGQYCKYRRK